MDVLCEYRTGSSHDGIDSVEYIYGVEGKLVQLDFDEGYHWYYKDHLGSTRDMGDAEFYRDYYPFSQDRVASSTDETAYQFTGKEKDSNTGLIYFGARYYDPGIGRFISVDPLAEENTAWSPYSYSKNNPLNRIDPDGRNDLLAQLAAYFSAESHKTANDYNNFASSRIVIPQAGIDQSGAETFADAVQFLNDSVEQFQQNSSEVLSDVSEVSGIAAAGCYGAALLTAPVPPVSTAFATTGVVLDGISTGTAVGKAILTRETADIAEAGISVLGDVGAGSAIGSILKNADITDNFSMGITNSFIQLPKQILNKGVNQVILDSNEEK